MYVYIRESRERERDVRLYYVNRTCMCVHTYAHIYVCVCTHIYIYMNLSLDLHMYVFSACLLGRGV